MPVPEITPQELAERLRRPNAQRPALLDVRTYGEHQLVAFPGSLHIPLHELEERSDEWEELRGREVIVYCHHGVRSLAGTAILRERGIEARSLAGGIDLYSVTVDQTLPRY